MPGLRRPTRQERFPPASWSRSARIAGFTLGITTENVPELLQLRRRDRANEPSDLYLSGRKMEGVWFENREASAAHQAQMPRVPSAAITGSPSRRCARARLDPPDICLFYGNPAQMILFINGLQWRNYQRYDFSDHRARAPAPTAGAARSATARGQPVDPLLRRAALRRRRRRRDADGAARPPTSRAPSRACTGLSKAGLRYPDHALRPAGRSREGWRRATRARAERA